MARHRDDVRASIERLERTLARVHGELKLEVAGRATQRSVLDALEVGRSMHSAAAALGEATTVAPAATSGASRALSMSWTTSSNPALTRLSAIGPPMLPRPMKAMVRVMAFSP